MMKLALAFVFCLFASLANAQGCGPQNPNCIVPTAPPGTSNNQAASTAFVQNAMGGGGGGGSNFSTGAIFAGANLGSSAFATIQSQNGGISICPLNYTKGTITPTGSYQEILNVPSGIYWQAVFDTSPIRACQFGTVPDGTFNQSNNAVGGTDNTSMIQNALDYAMRNHFQTVCLDDGQYKTTDTIAVGWGQAVYGLSLQACNLGRANYVTIRYGVSLFSTQSDRCVVNIAGSRQGSLKGIGFLGQNYVFNINAFLTTPIPTTAAGYLDPLITPTGNNPGGISQHAPYSAICIDAYHGPQPANAYPPQTFPSWTGIVSQYNQAASSDISIEDILIQGFPLGVNLMPNSDGNGDFLKVLNYSCANMIYCVSIGQTQARATTVTNLSCGRVYTVLTNTKFGTLNGELGGNLINASCSGNYQVLDINTGIAGLTVQDLYVEAGVRIGSISGGSISFNNCKLDLNDFNSGIVPAALLETTGLSVTFNDCNIGNTGRITTMYHSSTGTGNVTWNGGELNGAIHAGTLFPSFGVAAQHAVNYTGGYLMGAFVYPNGEFPVQLSWMGQTLATFMATPSSVANLSNAGWMDQPNVGVSSRLPWTQAMRGFIDIGADRKRWTFTRGPTAVTIDLTTGNFPTPLTSTGCDTWAGQWSASQQGTTSGNLQPGDMFYHAATGTIFVVESIGVQTPTHYPIVLRQHNNMTVVNTTSACLTNNLVTIPSGNSFLIHTGQNIAALTAAIAAGGSGYTNGTQTLTLVNSAGYCPVLPTVSVTVAGNVVTSINSITNPGNCGPLTNPVATIGGGGAGATLTMTWSSGVISIPGTAFFCDFANGSATLTNCHRGDGNGTTLSTVLFPGDKFWPPALNDPALQFPFKSPTSISTVTSGSPGTVGLTNTVSKNGRFPLLPFTSDVVGRSANELTAVPTQAAAGGTCAAANPPVGNQTRGALTLTGVCAAGNTVTLTFAIVAPVGWFCSMNDRTTPATLFNQTASTTTVATFTATGTTGATDVLGFECAPY